MARSTFRQRRLYTFTADLYKPVMTVDPNGVPSDLEYVLAYSGVKCYYMATTEIDMPTGPQGRTKQDNIQTLDQFHFYPDQEIQDVWYVHLTGPVSYAENDGWWAVLGNPQTVVGNGARNPNYRQVYGKRGVRPTLQGEQGG